MTVRRGVSTAPALVPNGTAIMYAPPAATRAVITAITMHANAAATGVQLYILGNSGTASNTTLQVLKDFAAGETYSAPDIIGQAVQAGGSINANDGSGSGTEVNITITVTEFSGDS